MLRATQHVVFGLALLAAPLLASAQPPPAVQIPRVSRPPTLDDFVAGTPREAEAVLTEFRQREPADGDPVSQPTAAYLSYDATRLYIVFVCRDDPAKVRARLGRREAIFEDDYVGVLLDTFRDRQRAYAFATNPLGVQLDGVTTEGQGDDFSFDTVWQSAGRLTADGYVVWMAIPFRSLRFPSGPSQSWGIGLIRHIARDGELTFWPLVTRRIAGVVPQLGTLDGLAEISPGRNIQLNPYAAVASARLRDASGGPRSLDERRAGLDAKLVARDAVTFDLAVNPDFSQVESDEPQVTINQRFEVFFPEKRPFFMENAGFFETPERLFFSRRVADPDVGVRASGKVGRWALGGVATDDRAIANGRNGRAGIGVLRVKREFARESSAGMFLSSRNTAPGSNTVVAADVRLKLSPTWSVLAQATRSITHDEAEVDEARATTRGAAHALQLHRNARRVNAAVVYVHRSPQFEAPLGFIQRTDLHQLDGVMGYRWYPNRGRLQHFGPGVYGLANWDHRGRLQDWVVHPSLGFIFTGRTSAAILHREAYEVFQTREFRRRTTTVQFNTGWVQWLGIGIQYNWGTNINYFPAPGLTPFVGDFGSAQVSLTLRPSGRALIEQTYLHDRLSTGGDARGSRVFSLHILRWKLNYQFTRELSLRAILDYDTVTPNASLVNLQRRRSWSGDLLLTYLLHPGTAVFVGYTNRQDRVGMPPGHAADGRSRSTARQFFVKTSYLLRF